jgi:hypothetical protein
MPLAKVNICVIALDLRGLVDLINTPGNITDDVVILAKLKRSCGLFRECFV